MAKMTNSLSNMSLDEMLQLPDDEFEKMYLVFKSNADLFFNMPSVKKAALDSAYAMPNSTQEERDTILKEQIDAIENDDTLSEIKKQFLIDLITRSAQLTNSYIVNPRSMVNVKIKKLNPNAIIPQYAHPTDAGADICAIEETKIEAGETKLVKTGLAVAIPAGYEIQIRPRSGLSLKTGLRIANSPGTCDADYRGEIGIIMTNTGDIPYVIDAGMKIAQLVIAPVPMIEWQEVEELDDTARGDKGFGSTDSIANES